MSNETNDEFCATCRFWEQIVTDEYDEDEDVEIFGKCRKAHPKIVDKLLKDCDDIYSATQFPQTSAEEWCGEYEAADDRV